MVVIGLFQLQYNRMRIRSLDFNLLCCLSLKDDHIQIDAIWFDAIDFHCIDRFSYFFHQIINTKIAKTTLIHSHWQMLIWIIQTKFKGNIPFCCVVIVSALKYLIVFIGWQRLEKSCGFGIDNLILDSFIF